MRSNRLDVSKLGLCVIAGLAMIAAGCSSPPYQAATNKTDAGGANLADSSDARPAKGCLGQLPTVFDSGLALQVYAFTHTPLLARSDRLPFLIWPEVGTLGRTPSVEGQTIRIPPGSTWYVEPTNTELADEDLRILATEIAAKGIPGLSLKGCERITDEGLRHIGGLVHLQYLELPPKVTDAGLVHLERLSHLRVLKAMDCKGMSDAGMRSIGKLSDLRTLWLFYWEGPLTNAGVAELSPLVKLEELHLYGCEGITDAGMKHLAKLESLEGLYLNRCAVSGVGLALLKGLSRLSMVGMGGLGPHGGSEWVTDAGLEVVADLQGLSELHLFFCASLTDAGVAHLKNLGNLRILNLNMCYGITDGGIKELASLTGLKRLDLVSTQVSPDGIKHLAGMKQMVTLELPGSAVDDENITFLAGMTNLRMLDIGGAKISADGVAVLANLPELRTLDLSCTSLADEEWAPLAKLSKLESLDVSGSRNMSGAGLASIGRLNTLRELSVSHCAGISDADLKELSALVNLQQLDMSGTNITGTGLKHLQNLPQLRNLILSTDSPHYPSPQLSDDGLSALRGFRRLESLSLAHCPGLTDAGLVHVGFLCGLRSLDLGVNERITDAGLVHLEGLTSLAELDLYSCRGITDASVPSLKKLRHLTRLDIFDTQITKQGRTELLGAIPGVRVHVQK